MEEQLEKLMRETVDDRLYQIILSNPRDRDSVFKIKIRPVMVKGRLLFQQTRYEGTKVFHENLDRDAVIRNIGDALERDFRQCEVSHQICKAVILISRKGRMTINKRIMEAKEQADAGRAVRLAHNRKKRYILEDRPIV